MKGQEVYIVVQEYLGIDRNSDLVLITHKPQNNIAVFDNLQEAIDFADMMNKQQKNFFCSVETFGVN